MAYIKIDTNALLKADWAAKGETLFKQLVSDVKANDDLFKKEMKAAQENGQDVMKRCDDLVKKVEGGGVPPTAYPGVIAAAERFKRELADAAKQADAANSGFFDAMEDFRNVYSWKSGTITDTFAERIGKLRTLSQNQAKVVSATKTKMNDDYTMRLSGMTKLLKVLAGKSKGDADLDKKSASLFEKITASIKAADDAGKKFLKTIPLMERDAKSKNPAQEKTVKSYFSDFERLDKLYRAHLKTARELAEIMAKLPASQALIDKADLMIKTLDPQKESLVSQHKAVIKVVKEAKLKTLKDFKYPPELKFK